ncbi:tyrosinase-like [Montipora foliosa]|uniref:tyrosinase-like n=1 Tax=Montipora foliosa TaxID=591990 RepID=UPI0035F102C4
MKFALRFLFLYIYVAWLYWLPEGKRENKVALNQHGAAAEVIWCEEGSYVLNRCEERCECQNGKPIKCFRVRKEFTKMDIKEKKRYIYAYKTASVNPYFKLDYERLVALHINAPDQLLHHTPFIFLPWHRWFLVEFENLLRRIDCRVTVPYWNWSRVANYWWRSAGYTDIWNSGEHGLGGDGNHYDHCVEDGPFSKDKWHLLDVSGGGCLQRNFSRIFFTGNAQHVKRTLALPLNDFLLFENIVRANYHRDVHDFIGGTMWSSSTSSNAPEVVFHHSFLDKIWLEWQKKGEDYKNVFYRTLPNYTMPGSNYFAWQWTDSSNLPGQVQVLYEE